MFRKNLMLVPVNPLLPYPYACFACFYSYWSWLKEGRYWLYTNCVTRRSLMPIWQRRNKKKTSKKTFEYSKWCIVKYNSMCFYILCISLFTYTKYKIIFFIIANQHPGMQIEPCEAYLWSMSMNPNVTILAWFLC